MRSRNGWRLVWTLALSCTAVWYADGVDVTAVRAGEITVVHDDGHGNSSVPVPAGRDDHNGRVTICHITPADASNRQTLQVGEEAVAAHMAHGDTMGACLACVCPPGVAACVCADGSPGAPGVNAATTVPHNLREIYGR